MNRKILNKTCFDGKFRRIAEYIWSFQVFFNARRTLKERHHKLSGEEVGIRCGEKLGNDQLYMCANLVDL